MMILGKTSRVLKTPGFGRCEYPRKWHGDQSGRAVPTETRIPDISD
jgi:hypothetical protein